MNRLKILVDADASPVQTEIIEMAQRFAIQVVLVKSYAHFSIVEDEGVETVYVDQGADAADYKIIQLSTPGDVIVTGDYGLAALGLEKQCIVMHHTGFFFSKESMDRLLMQRHEGAMRRKSGQRTKGPKPFTNEEREYFRTQLEKVLIGLE
ncbi:YaiI/YqxD family protein [Geomicrobium sp. JSM 1781026]|uniref:YaiI/YqxD family protein n=1 Tax=unclassified Geomicrobium TaxID=2628951 RepID=UPI0035A374D2